MVPEFQLIEFKDVPTSEYTEFGVNADMVETFMEMNGTQALKLGTDETTVRKIHEYTILQNAAFRRGYSVRSLIRDGLLYIWKEKKEVSE